VATATHSPGTIAQVGVIIRGVIPADVSIWLSRRVGVPVEVKLDASGQGGALLTATVRKGAVRFMTIHRFNIGVLLASLVLLELALVAMASAEFLCAT
jgi:hypothetical protein